MKIIGICGSPRKNKSTTLFSLEKALKAAEHGGIKTSLINLSDYTFSGCIACGKCRKEITCSIDDDFKNKIIPLLNDSEIKGIIYATPVYMGGVTSLMKAFIDRCVMFRRNGFLFKDIIAGALTVGNSRNGGQELAALDIIKSCLIQGMIIVPDAPPTSHFGGLLWSGNPEGIEGDNEGIKSAVNLGEKMAEIVKKLN